MPEDVFGRALAAYNNGEADASITVESDLAETDEWPVSEFFHSWDDMSAIERRALTLASGRILDVGAGSGSHTLWLQGRDADVEALDLSAGAAGVMRSRGVRSVHQADFFSFRPDKGYDTLLFLMNGVGIAGSVERLDDFLAKAKSLLSPGGQILLDSSDLIYLYEEEDGSYSLPIGGRYYGELTYTYVFRGLRSEPFDWVFVDRQTLSDTAEREGLSLEIVCEGEHYDYLARLTSKR